MFSALDTEKSKKDIDNNKRDKFIRASRKDKAVEQIPTFQEDDGF